MADFLEKIRVATCRTTRAFLGALLLIVLFSTSNAFADSGQYTCSSTKTYSCCNASYYKSSSSCIACPTNSTAGSGCTTTASCTCASHMAVSGGTKTTGLTSSDSACEYKKREITLSYTGAPAGCYISDGTTKLYATYATGVYTNSNRTNLMGTSTNPVTKPTSNCCIFGGYYTGQNGSGSQMINSNGYIKGTSSSYGRNLDDNTTWYSKWTATTGELVIYWSPDENDSESVLITYTKPGYSSFCTGLSEQDEPQDCYPTDWTNETTSILRSTLYEFANYYQDNNGYTFVGLYAGKTCKNNTQGCRGSLKESDFNWTDMIMNENGYLQSTLMSDLYNAGCGSRAAYARWVPSTCNVTFHTGSATYTIDNFQNGDTIPAMTSMTAINNAKPSASYGWNFVGWGNVNGTTKVWNNNASGDGAWLCDFEGQTKHVYGIWSRTVDFKYYNSTSSDNATTSNRTQYYYNSAQSTATTGNVSTYALINGGSDTGWSKLGWRTDTTAAAATVAQTGSSTTTVNPGATSGNSTGVHYYAVYKRVPGVGFKANGGSGETYSHQCGSDQFLNTSGNATEVTCTLDNPTFTPPSNKAFVGWSPEVYQAVTYQPGYEANHNVNWADLQVDYFVARWECAVGYTLNSSTGACVACASGTYKNSIGDGACSSCSALGYPSGYSSGTFSSVSPFDANTTCRFTGPSKSTPSNCSGISANTVSYTSSGWNTPTYHVTSAAGYRITANDVASPTCAMCGAGTYTDGNNKTSCTNVTAGYYNTGAGTNATGSVASGSGKTGGMIAAGYYGAAGAGTSTGTGAVNAGYYNTGAGTNATGSVASGSGKAGGSVTAGYYNTGCGTNATGGVCNTSSYSGGQISDGYYCTAGAKKASPASASDSTNSSSACGPCSGLGYPSGYSSGTFTSASVRNAKTQCKFTAPTPSTPSNCSGVSVNTVQYTSSNTWPTPTYHVTSAPGKYIATQDVASPTCGACASPNYSDTANATSCKACSALGYPSGYSSSNGSFSSVSPYNANTTCRFTGTKSTPSNCSGISGNAVSYTGSAWNTPTFTVTSSAGKYITKNNDANPTCAICGAGKYTDGNNKTSCSNVDAGYFTTGGGMSKTPNTTVGGAAGTGSNGCLSGYTCGKIAAGYYGAAGAGTSTGTGACGAGTYSSGGASSCSNVTAGYYNTGCGTNATGSVCSSSYSGGEISSGYYCTAGAKKAAPTSASDSVSSSASCGACSALTPAVAVTGGTYSSVSVRNANTTCRYVGPDKSTPSNCSGISKNTVSYSGSAWGTNLYTVTSAAGNIITSNNTSSPTCSACASPNYSDGANQTSCKACSSLTVPSSGWVTGGTYSSVSPFNAATTCRYKAPDMSSTPTNCSGVTTNTVSYTSSGWNKNIYTVTSVAGKYITSNNNSNPTCGACASPNYSDGANQTSCKKCADLTAPSVTGGTFSSVSPYNANTTCRYKLADINTPSNCSSVTTNTVSYTSSGWGTGYYTVTSAAGYRITANNNSAPTCAMCGAGTYTDGNNKTSCTNVTAGYYNTGAGTNATGSVASGSGKTGGMITAGYYGGAGATSATGTGAVNAGYYNTGAGNSATGGVASGSGKAGGSVTAGYYNTGCGTNATGGVCNTSSYSGGQISDGYYCTAGAKKASPASASDSTNSSSACGPCSGLGYPSGYSSGTFTSASVRNAKTQCKFTAPTPSTPSNCSGVSVNTVQYTSSNTWPTPTFNVTSVAGNYITANGVASPTCAAASKGYYVSGANATSQTACPAGTYTSSTGQSGCSNVTAGYYNTGCGTNATGSVCSTSYSGGEINSGYYCNAGAKKAAPTSASDSVSSSASCGACSGLTVPTSGWVTGGTYSSVSVRNAATTCRYKAPDMSSTPTNCSGVTTNTVSYTSSGWNKNIYTVTSVAGKYITSNNNSNPTCGACASPNYSDGANQTSCKKCADLTAPSVTGGTFSSVSPYNANTTCRYKLADINTPSNCSGVTTNTVSYSGSAWGTSYYTVTSAAGYRITANNNSAPTCAMCGAGTYTDGNNKTSCTNVTAGYYNTGAGTNATGSVASGSGKTGGMITAGYYGGAGATSATGTGAVNAGYYNTGAGNSATGGVASGSGKTGGSVTAGYYNTGCGTSATGAVCSSSYSGGEISSGYYCTAGAKKAAPASASDSVSSSASCGACSALTPAVAVTGGTYSSVSVRNANTTCRYVGPDKSTPSNCSGISKNTVSYSGSAWGTNLYTVTSAAGNIITSNNTSSPTCSACASPNYSDGANQTSCKACSSLTVPSSGWVANGTYSSVSPFNANTTCRYKAPDMSSTPSNCSGVTTNTVTYSGSAWNTNIYTVTSAAGKYITSNNNSNPTCGACASPNYSDGANQTSCKKCADLTAPSVTGGTYSSVSPYNANTTCRYVGPNKDTPANCSGISKNTVSYNGSAWGTGLYTVTSAAGRRITANNTSAPTCAVCGAGTYTSSTNQTSCSNVSAGYYNTGCGTSATGAVCSTSYSGGGIGAGYYCSAGAKKKNPTSASDSVSSSAQCGACTSPLTTIGYGPGADEAGDCGRKFHAGDGYLYLRSTKKGSKALNVKVGSTTFYGNMSTTEKNMSDGVSKKLKVKDGNTTYWVHDDSVN